MIMGLVPGLSLAVHLSWPMFGLIQGPPGGVHIFPAKMDSRVRVSGRLVGPMLSLPILCLAVLQSLNFFRLVYSGSTSFFVEIFCCETTQAE